MEKDKFIEIFNNDDELHIWEKLPNGCFIGTLTYSEKNISILLKLLKSFEEQYGEVIDYDAAKEELMLYHNQGKLFIYFDQDMNPVSMNGCIYDYDNETVDFIGTDKEKLKSLYFYGLSTIPSYRGKGACNALVRYALTYAFYNGFDFVYARTDLTNSNSEGIMKRADMEICKFANKIIAEWVDVTEDTGDYRLHLWLPLHDGIIVIPKNDALFANDDDKREIVMNNKKLVYAMKKE